MLKRGNRTATQLLYKYGSYLKGINFHMLPLKLEIRHLPSANLINSSPQQSLVMRWFI